MKFTKIFVSKNNYKEKDNQPDLHLSGISEDGKFIKIAALWKAKSGKGYSGKVDETTVIEYTENPIVPKFDRDSRGNPIVVEKKAIEVTPEDINF